MKFNKKIFVLKGFIQDTIDQLAKRNYKRIKKDKPVPSGLFAYEFEGKGEIRVFGDVEKLHNAFVTRCGNDAKFQRFLSSVIAETQTRPTVQDFIEDVVKMKNENKA